MTNVDRRIQTKSQLGELALDAAIALETISTNNRGDLTIVDDFIQAVKSQLAEDSSVSAFRDSSLYPVYSYALSKTEGTDFDRSEDFKHRLRRTIARYDEGSPDLSEVDNLKRFCLAVHEALLTDLMGRRISSTRNDERIR